MMQLGTRWPFGAEPPARLPDAVVAAIREVEAKATTTLSVGSSDADRQDPVGHFVRRWTLTWLEGKPCAELDPESGSDEVTVVRFDPKDGSTRITVGDSDEEWVEE